MTPAPAHYLLRFDDLCPTMARDRWARFEQLVSEFDLRPILAVVPDNRDPDLIRDEPDPAFWSRMRALQSSGAAIAFHGLHHTCLSRGPSLLPFHRETEFAGMEREAQRRAIQQGLAILRAHGLDPRLWVAPRHGFDRNTLAALAAEGVAALSDGLARIPFRRQGLTWIPQQLWAPVAKPSGLWTICIHPNTATDEFVATLRAFLAIHSDRFTSVESVLRAFPAGPLPLGERIYEAASLARLRLHRWIRPR